MTKLTELFAARPPVPAPPATLQFTAPQPAEAPAAKKPDVEIDVAEETGAEASTRLGGECEALRNLIIEAGCKINEIDELRQSFVNIVDPAEQALRALEQEKTVNITLNRRLAALRTAHQTLLAKYDEVEDKRETAQTDKERFRLELEEEQRAARELKRIKAELTNDVAVSRARAISFEQQLADQALRIKTLSEDNQRLRNLSIEAEAKLNASDSELRATRENLSILQGENQSLQKSLTAAVTESTTLSQRSTESDTALTAARARVQQLETAFAAIEAERDKLTAEVADLTERQRNMHGKLQAQVEALRARSAMAEKLLANTRQLLGTRSDEARGSNRHATDAKRARDAAEARMREMEAALKAQEDQTRETERARIVLLDRNAALVNSLKSYDARLAEAEEQRLATTEELARRDNETKMMRLSLEQRIDELLSSLDHERLERQVLEGALDATRRDRAQLQHDLYRLRMAARRGRTAEDTSEAPAADQASPRSADAA